MFSLPGRTPPDYLPIGMAAQRKRSSDEERLQAALTKARGVLSERGALAGAKLGALGIRPRVVEQLLRDGYEAAGTGVRVPLSTQGERLLGAGAHVPLATLPKRLAGASKAEADKLVKELCRSGKAHLVLRGKQLSLISGAEAVIERSALADVEAELRGTVEWIKRALSNKSGATVLGSDLRQAIDEVALRVPKRESPKPLSAALSNGKGEPSLSLALRGAVLAVRDEESLLASVPEMSRRLRERATAEQVRTELLAAYRRGELELRPEGGMGRLSAADAALCPVGAGGVPLSWVRLLEEKP